MNRERLPAITIIQPWASLIMAGLKRGEFRSWAAPKKFRNCRLAIHASASRLPQRDLLSLLGNYEGTSAIPFIEAALRREIAMGAVLGVVEIMRVAPAPSNEWDANFRKGFSGAGFLWEMEVKEAFENPVPARGSLGFWTWEYNPSGRRAEQGALWRPGLIKNQRSLRSKGRTIRAGNPLQGDL